MAFEPKLRATISQQVSVLEAILYFAVGLLLIVAAVTGVFQAAAALWRGIAGGALGPAGLFALDELLLVLMLVEILHTVRISIRTEKLTMVPFLVVGLIASIRRVLVITLQAVLTEQAGAKAPDQALAFRNSMIELGMMAILILVFVFCIARLGPGSSRDVEPEQP